MHVRRLRVTATDRSCRRRLGECTLGELFRFLLSEKHAPFSFDLAESTIRMNLTFHMSDVFAHAGTDEVGDWIAKFIAIADTLDNVLIDTYGCAPAQETLLKEQTLKFRTSAPDSLARCNRLCRRTARCSARSAVGRA